ncbi:transmembrane 9 family protein [Alkalihalobacterium alkalinitrilicum]|uniref:transmembrane 9 family protein n=1 Tax=Alkalihalobacterium alkalinitrilicum TaxID=427920 RepID=UPI00114DE29A|nr:transmembrane 9 family protein [Alkalihalobacterium alkalinitrilicum]
MRKKTPFWKKWWVWLIIVVVCINIFMTNVSVNNEDYHSERNELKKGNISSH